MAICFAFSLFLGIQYLSSRPTIESTAPLPAAGTTTRVIDIEGKAVQYTVDLDEAVILIQDHGAAAPPVQITQSQPPTITAVSPRLEIEKIIFTSYTVQNGDTLYSVAAHFDWASTISLMAKYNIAADNIVPENILSPFPIANPAYCPGHRPYVVEESETASTIARTVGTTIETLKEINNLDDQYTVYVTDVLCVP